MGQPATSVFRHNKQFYLLCNTGHGFGYSGLVKIRSIQVLDLIDKNERATTYSMGSQKIMEEAIEFPVYLKDSDLLIGARNINENLLLLMNKSRFPRLINKSNNATPETVAPTPKTFICTKNGIELKVINSLSKEYSFSSLRKYNVIYLTNAFNLIKGNKITSVNFLGNKKWRVHGDKVNINNKKMIDSKTTRVTI